MCVCVFCANFWAKDLKGAEGEPQCCCLGEEKRSERPEGVAWLERESLQQEEESPELLGRCPAALAQSQHPVNVTFLFRNMPLLRKWNSPIFDAGLPFVRLSIIFFPLWLGAWRAQYYSHLQWFNINYKSTSYCKFILKTFPRSVNSIMISHCAELN